MAGCRSCFNDNLPYLRARYSNAAGSPGMADAREPCDRRVVDGVAGLVQVHVARCGRGRLLARVDHGFEGVRLTVQQIEAAAAKTRTRGFDHCQRGGHRHRRVEGVAAGGENFLPCLTRERIGAGNRALVRNRGGGRAERGGRRNERGACQDPAGKLPRAARCENGDQSLRCRFNSVSTIGCTNSDTLPPSTAISRTRVEEINVYCSCGVMNTDSISGVRCRLILAN